MKRILMIFLAFTLVVVSVELNVMASETPSHWAINEVDAAIAGGLVPKVLRSDYQANVKRYEYVLLALELVDLVKEDVYIVYERPFKDISGHAYEEEIIKAYNLGLINGYKDGSFRADQFITRQEIATLIVNLVKIINEDEIIGGSDEYVYSDAELIGSWAMKNINYCYAKGIIKGIGQDKLLRDIINPNGNATIEQAVLVIYRLAVDKDIYMEPIYSGIVISDTDEDKSPEFNAFARAAGNEIAEELNDLQVKSYAMPIDITESYVEIGHKDGSDMSINLSSPLEVRLELKDPDNLVMINAYNELLALILSDIDVTDEVTSSIHLLKSNIDNHTTIELSETETLYIFGYEIETDAGVVELVYVIQYLAHY